MTGTYAKANGMKYSQRCGRLPGELESPQSTPR